VITGDKELNTYNQQGHITLIKSDSKYIYKVRIRFAVLLNFLYIKKIVFTYLSYTKMNQDFHKNINQPNCFQRL